MKFCRRYKMREILFRAQRLDNDEIEETDYAT